MSKGKSYLTSLFTFYDQMASSVYERRAVDVVYIDFRKTFGIISRSIFTVKLTEQSQFPQRLLIRLVLETLHQLCCSSLDTLQHLNVFPVPNTGGIHFLSPAGHPIPDTSQNAIGLLGHLGTLLTHIQPTVDQCPQVLFCQAALRPLFPKAVVLHGVVAIQVPGLALGLVEPHTINDLSPLIQPDQIPLKIFSTLQQINTPLQLGVVCKLTEGVFDPLVQIKILNRTGFNTIPASTDVYLIF
ncbi:integral membrane protein dgcr2 idd [Limosa lapponica baueri]|uniref:Integral membrane protein dgcr2 idd n=1 Tax=Limosa lapponica baueri TaxID=1758121 RepID=A0A2I0U8A2_LIMLA|nr:integral membrane protein dgcr2 idd [Limosa lapponica baueri]